MKALIVAMAVLVLTACSGWVKLLEEGKAHSGKYDSMNKSLEVSINGTLYSGNYVLNSSASYGGIFTGTRYVPINSYTGGNMGRAILTSPDGKVLRCEFMVQGSAAQGACSDNNGKHFDLIAGQ